MRPEPIAVTGATPRTVDLAYPVGASTAIADRAFIYIPGSYGTANVEIPEVTSVEFWWDATAQSSYVGDFTSRGIVRRLGGAGDLSMWLSVQWDDSASAWVLDYLAYQSDVSSLYGTASPAATLSAVEGANHICGTLDGSDFKVYLNGSLVYTMALS